MTPIDPTYADGVVLTLLFWVVMVTCAGVIWRQEWAREGREDWITPRSAWEAAVLLGIATLLQVDLIAVWLVDAYHRQDVLSTVLLGGSLVLVGLLMALTFIVWKRRPSGKEQPRLFPTMVMPSRLADAGATLGIRRVQVLSAFALLTAAVVVVGITVSIQHH